jgi:UDP-N-acetylmuramoyl-tripeptide--D-alanyl-D-alanine ligase
VVGGLGPTVAPVGSYNNEIGLPLTALRAEESTRFVVLEAAARGIGHIAALCRAAPPRVGIVLNVGTAHVGEFGGREAIAVAKGELVEALPPAEEGGVAVLNADDPAVAAMAARTRARVVTYGLGGGAMVTGEDVEIDTAGRASFRLRTAAGEGRVRLALAGEHMVSNALAVAAVAMELGLTPEQTAEALTEARPLSQWRMEVVARPDGVTVVNDAYNANPESAAAALTTLHRMAGAAAGARSIAVLGHMAELGADHEAEHERLGRLAAELGTDLVVTVGRDAAPIATGARSVAEWKGDVEQVADAEAAAQRLGPWLRGGDVVVVKGSRVAALERLARRLGAEGGTQ